MTRIVVVSAFIVCSCIIATAEEPVPLPKDVPPVVGTAIAIPPAAPDDAWSIKLSVPKVKWEIVGKERPKIEWPEFKVAVEGASLILPMKYAPASQLSEIAQNRILNLEGKKLSREEILKRLATSKPVLVSVSGRMPDAFYLQTTKPDTLIVVLGIPSAPAPDYLPQSARTSQKP